MTADDPLSAGDIEEGFRRSRVDFEPGDALLLYMGRDRFEAEGHSLGSVAQSSGGARPSAGE